MAKPKQEKEKNLEKDLEKDLNEVSDKEEQINDASSATGNNTEENITTDTEDTSKDSELEKAKEQIAALSDKMIRKAAEFDNYKKRTAREREDFYKSSVCETVLPFLNVLDNFERAVDAAEKEDGNSSVLDGIKMIKKQFEDALTSIGVEPIDAVGCEFDPEKHNAVMTDESDEKENTVIEEFQKGYVFRDKVIRHSMVKVSN